MLSDELVTIESVSVLRIFPSLHSTCGSSGQRRRLRKCCLYMRSKAFKQLSRIVIDIKIGKAIPFLVAVENAHYGNNNENEKCNHPNGETYNQKNIIS